MATHLTDETDQPALFQVDGPDEDGCVWICSSEFDAPWCRNLGPTDQVVEVLSQWLGSIDAAKRTGASVAE